MTEEKTCTKCNITKPTTEFHKCKGGKFGVRPDCKVCHIAHIRQNKEAKAAYDKQYYLDNKEAKTAYRKQYYQENKKAINTRKIEHQRNRHRTDPIFKLQKNMRSRFYSAIKGHYKTSSVWDLVGLPAHIFKDYIAVQFQDGMSWDNYGEWHIDHIRPVASFKDPQDPECWHFTNLQPMWAEENIKKNSHYEGIRHRKNN